MNPILESKSERTRAAILRAFVEMLFRGGFEAVSVQAIVAQSGIARSTFYEHFSNKNDVLRASMAQFLTVLATCVSSEEQPVELENVLSHFWSNRRLTDAIFSGDPRRIVALALSEMVEARLHERSSEELLLPYRLAAIHIAEAQLALIENWLRGRAFANVEAIAAAVYRSSNASAAALRGHSDRLS